jgi:hypothetical protein
MRILNEERTTELSTTGGRTIEGRVQVRGIDARTQAQGFLYERHVPVALVVREGSEVREIPIESESIGRRVMPFVVAPVVAWLITRGLRGRRRRR